MPVFRVYIVGRYGNFLRAHDFDAATIEEAIHRAPSFSNDHDLELWEGQTLIKRFEAANKNTT
jgi:hypothetical protein